MGQAPPGMKRLTAHGPNGGKDFGSHTCKPGEIVTKLYGRGGRLVDRVCATCSDGKDLGCYGGGGGSPWTRQGPFTKVYGRKGSKLDDFMGGGGGGGSPWSESCP